MKQVFLWIGGIILFFAILFILNVGGMYSKSFFGKWNEEIRYDIQKESQAHRDGLQRNLASMQTDYLNADSAGKAVIEAAVRHQYSQVDTSEFPPHLQQFLNQVGM